MSKLETKLEALKEKVEAEFKALEEKLKGFFHSSNHDTITDAIAAAKSGVHSAVADVAAPGVVLSDADAAADLAGTPRTGSATQSKTDAAIQENVEKQVSDAIEKP